MQLLNAIVMIDGNNLYCGMQDAGLQRLMWLDILGFAHAVKDKHHRLVHCYYFTSRIRDSHDRPASEQSQYLRALELWIRKNFRSSTADTRRRNCVAPSVASGIARVRNAVQGCTIL